MTRILVTGASGFIGGHCLDRLRDSGHEVHAVSTKPRASNEPWLEWHQADLLSSADTATLMAAVEPTHLLHLAWFVEHGKYTDATENLHWVRASIELVERFVEHRGRRLIGCGSCAEYDWNAGFCSETTTPLRPLSYYGESKRSFGSLLLGYAEGSGISAAWARVFFLYGPGGSLQALIPAVALALLRAERAPCTIGRQMRDYLYVADVADALITLLMSDLTGPINIGSGRPRRLCEIVRRIADALDGADLVDRGAIDGSREPPMVVADIRRLERELGWSPSWDLDAGLAKTIEWLRAEYVGQRG